jgi:dihydroorotate dehydrogenase (fumarate)/dihydroorotate dehydrogenase
MSMYRSVVRPLLFNLDPERVHHLTMDACRIAERSSLALGAVQQLFGSAPDPRLVTTVAGVHFKNPVGLSAGYDKNGAAAAVLSRMGFGYLDIGSVSNVPSTGNAARPRLWRLPSDDALMVFYGVPNDGAAVVASRLAARPSHVPIGVTLVETNTGRPSVPEHVIDELADAAAPFLGSIDMLFISAACPNETSGNRPFSDFGNLERLFEKLGRYPNLPPVFLKIKASVDEIDRLVEIARPFPFIKGFQPSVGPPRPYVGLYTPDAEIERLPGSATGPFLKPYLRASLTEWYARIDRTRHVLIANGGICSGADAYAAIRAGASLVGFVTALIYHGPGLARRINRELAELLKRDGFAHVNDAVGADHAAT